MRPQRRLNFANRPPAPLGSRSTVKQPMRIHALRKDGSIFQIMAGRVPGQLGVIFKKEKKKECDHALVIILYSCLNFTSFSSVNDGRCFEELDWIKEVPTTSASKIAVVVDAGVRPHAPGPRTSTSLATKTFYTLVRFAADRVNSWTDGLQGVLECNSERNMF